MSIWGLLLSDSGLPTYHIKETSYILSQISWPSFSWGNFSPNTYLLIFHCQQHLGFLRDAQLRVSQVNGKVKVDENLVDALVAFSYLTNFLFFLLKDTLKFFVEVHTNTIDSILWKKIKTIYLMNWYYTLLIYYGPLWHIDGLVQERRNSIANALELRLFLTKPSILYHDKTLRLIWTNNRHRIPHPHGWAMRC